MASSYDPEKFRLAQLSDKPGERALKLRKLQVPVALVLGHLEKLTDVELEELYHDIDAEYERRGTTRSVPDASVPA